jgi:23S rRNA (pseudouridine1915-N3)-methyltransferase
VVTYRFFFVGRHISDALVTAVDQYLARLAHYAKVDLKRLKDSTPQEESAQMLRQLKPIDPLIALDERGTSISTQELCRRVSRWQQEGRTISFAIGGADGLDACVLKRAQESWSLSAMTLPHRLAQIVLVEQLYRSHSYLRGEPYHRVGPRAAPRFNSSCKCRRSNSK